MKKASAKKILSPARRAARPAAKPTVKRVARQAAKMTQRAATSALTEIEHSLGVLKKSKVGQGAAAAGHDTVKAALAVATKLNRVVKGMKSAKLI
jgi:hypothetical protein